MQRFCAWASPALALLVAAPLVGQEPERAGRLPEPDPLRLGADETVSSPREWFDVRSPEIRELFDRHVYGRMPGRPADMRFDVRDHKDRALDGVATRKQVTVRFGAAGREGSLDLLLYLPAERRGLVPVFLGLNFYGNHTVVDDPDVALCSSWLPARAAGVVDHRATDVARGTSMQRWSIRQTLLRGYGVATVYHGDLAPDRPGFEGAVHPLFYREGQVTPESGEWGALAAWAWGLHRAMDYLVTDPDVDAQRVAVLGHSRNGKAALWAGATDERFALVISNQSGCGGAALSRRRVGETVKKINDRFPHWFCANFKAFDDRESELPVDQHMLIALIAPRPVLVCSAAEDRWADPEGEFAALAGADSVYRLLGTEGLAVSEMPPPGMLVRSTLGYHIRTGRHAIGPGDWTVFADFADRHFGR